MQYMETSAWQALQDEYISSNGNTAILAGLQLLCSFQNDLHGIQNICMAAESWFLHGV